MPYAIDAPLIAAHDTDRTESHALICAYCSVVMRCRINDDPVMPTIIKEMTRQSAQSVGSHPTVMGCVRDVL